MHLNTSHHKSLRIASHRHTALCATNGEPSGLLDAVLERGVGGVVGGVARVFDGQRSGRAGVVVVRGGV